MEEDYNEAVQQAVLVTHSYLVWWRCISDEQPNHNLVEEMGQIKRIGVCVCVCVCVCSATYTNRC